MSQPFVVKHTVPVWVYVEDGKITKVVADDGRLSEPQTAVTGKSVEPEDDRDASWRDEDEHPITPEQRAEYDRAKAGEWPAWDWGW